MALFRGLFVRKDATRGTTPVEARKALAGLIAAAGPAAARPGLLGGGTVTGTSGWSYNVPALQAALTRGASDGVVLAGNDGVVQVGTDPAPASGARIDIVWIRHQDVDSGDATSDVVVGVAKGAASGTPQSPSIPAGALEIASARVGAGATNTQHANVTITQTGPRTAVRGAPVPVRDKAERDAYVSAFLAAGGVISALTPLWVQRADAPAGTRLQVTYDGTTWDVIHSRPETRPWTAVDRASGWIAHPDVGAIEVTRDGDWISVQGAISRPAGSAGVQLGFAGAIVGTLPTWARPRREHELPCLSNFQHLGWRIMPNGELRVRAHSGAPVIGPGGYVILDGFKWEATP